MGKIKTTIWDPAEYLESEEAIIMYLGEIFKSDDPKLIVVGIGDVIRARSMYKIADDSNGVIDGLYKSLLEEDNPSFEIILKVLSLLGLRLQPEPVSDAA